MPLPCDGIDHELIFPNGCAFCISAGVDLSCPNKKYHRMADWIVRNNSPYPEGKYQGRGIVITAGGSYWPSAYVSVRMIRHVGCDLPVQIWYMSSKGERDGFYEASLGQYNVCFVDADSHPARSKRKKIDGFGVKLFSVINSPFEEVLFLDADCYPCKDPAFLFDNSSYQETGGIYWPDSEFTNQWTNWKFWGVVQFGHDCGLETGQYVLNKRKNWDIIQLAEWYDDNQDWCYGAAHAGDHGDKGPHRVAWAKYRRMPTMFTTKSDWRSVAYVQPGPDGEPLFIHRCYSKFALGGESFISTPCQHFNYRANLPGECSAFGFLEELKQLVNSR